nr:hypothetical protein [Haloplanus rallus]
MELIDEYDTSQTCNRCAARAPEQRRDASSVPSGD